MRAEFDANKFVKDKRLVEKIVSDGEAKLAEFAHPDPYTLPHMPGGSKYMRYPGNGVTGPGDEITRIPSWLQ